MEENKNLENEKKVEITCKHISNIKKVEIESKRIGDIKIDSISITFKETESEEI